MKYMVNMYLQSRVGTWLPPWWILLSEPGFEIMGITYYRNRKRNSKTKYGDWGDIKFQTTTN